jgi:polyadenylate-binding protein
VRTALKKSERLQEIQKASEKFKLSMRKYNLYFKNLPQGTTDEELRTYFGRFGEIKSLTQMREKLSNPSDEAAQGRSLGFGFVCFASAESAARARVESRSLPFKDGATLTVCPFEPKATR